ncbi:LmeA family phospholipid-binding protein [bacterium]|nr:LmeA family phospholipid-binding protein [bacterium]
MSKFSFFSKIFLLLSLQCVLVAKPKLDLDLKTDIIQRLNEIKKSSSSEVSTIQKAFKLGLMEFLPVGNSLKVLFFPTKREDVLKGKFSRVDIRFRKGSLQGIEKLEIKKARIVVTGVSFDVKQLLSSGKLEIKKMENVKFNLRIDEGSINHYLESERKRLRLSQPRVHLNKDKMYFSARVKTAFFSSRLKTEGRFVVNKENQTVDFKTRRVSINSFKIPGFLVSNLTKKVNPVLKLNKFALMDLIPLKLDEIKIHDGWVEFKGL